MLKSEINRGIIIRNGFVVNGSWTKRVKHWRKSFDEISISTKIITAYPSKPNFFKNGTDGIYYLHRIKLPLLLLYFISPFLLFVELIKEKPQFVLIAHGGFWEFFTLPIYCKIAKIPLLVDIVDVNGRVFKNNKNLIDYIILYNKTLFDIFVVKYCYEIFVISSFLKSQYQSKFPNKRITRSIPTTVDVEEFKEVSKYEVSYLDDINFNVFNKDITKIFYAGTIARTNGIEFFLKVLSELIKENELNIKIVFAIVVGDVNNLLSLFSKYGLNSYYEIVPEVEQKYLPILLNKSDILFIPEQGNDTANAGFPGKTAEYLMSGNPVITTNFSDLGQYLINGENAFISDIGDFATYKNNLKNLLLNVDLRNKIGLAGKQLAIKSFSHKNCAMPYFLSIKSFYS